MTGDPQRMSKRQLSPAGTFRSPRHAVRHALQQIREEGIRRSAQQCIEACDQHIALAARRQRAEAEAEVFRLVRRHAVERVAHRERNGDMRERKKPVRIGKPERSRLLARTARFDDALDHVAMHVVAIGDDNGAIVLRTRRQNA